MFTIITNHVQAGLKRLITQYFNAINFQKSLTAFIEQIQKIEDELADMNIFRYLSDAYGEQLDNIGKIVGLPRPPGMADTPYRLEIYGQIKINISQGQSEQLIQVYALFTGTTQVRLFEHFPAEVQVASAYEPPDQNTTNSLIKTLNRTAPAGVAINCLIAYDPLFPFAYRVNVAPGSGYNTGKYPKLKCPIYPFGYVGNSSFIKGYGTRLDPLIGGSYAS